VSGVAPDGSPVEVFAALPAEPAAGYVLAALAPGSDVLELGCGAGRLTRVLAANGHRVVAVDESDEMLARVEGAAERVLADATSLDLRRLFDAVVLASYLVNHRSHGAAFLGAASRHLRPGGCALVQRYDPLWARVGDVGEATVGPVTIAVRRLVAHDGWFAASVAYTLGGREWVQEVEAAVLDDRAVEGLAASVGLTFSSWLDPHRTWAVLARP
jgi:SAM-dependent methyltransferase